MRVQFSPDVLAEPSVHGRDLNAIAECFDHGQHQWDIDDLSALLSSPWMGERPSWDSLDELAEKAFRAAADQPSAGPQPRLLVVTTNSTVASDPLLSVTPSAARRLLTESLHLVVENETSDGNFVRTLVSTYARHTLAVALARGWVVFEQSGGSGELVKKAKNLIDRGVPGLRIWCLMDSDRLAPGSLPKDTEKRVGDLIALGVEAFVLHKREVENYLPPSLLGDSRNRKVYVSWLSLSRTQQDYYDMKFGFDRDSATGGAKIVPEQSALFAGSNPWHLERLMGGFGKRIGERFDGSAIQLAEMEGVCVTAAGELERLLDRLESAL